MTKSKLDVRLEDKVSIKFTDHAIKNFEYDFKPGSKLRQGGVNFSNSGLKGLKLFHLGQRYVVLSLYSFSICKNRLIFIYCKVCKFETFCCKSGNKFALCHISLYLFSFKTSEHKVIIKARKDWCYKTHLDSYGF